jgi:hypothetical protein
MCMAGGITPYVGLTAKLGRDMPAETNRRRQRNTLQVRTRLRHTLNRMVLR